MTFKWWFAVVPVLPLLLVGTRMPGSIGPKQIGSYATTLVGRTPNQRHNARLALSEIQGVLIEPGKTFSFNQTLRGWTSSDGYKKAPVSYDGQLIDSWGGGVCQTSSTLYNAALLAGLQIVEHHSHQFAPSYVPPGRDAAVAYESVDLKLRNPYHFPIRIQGEVRGDRLVIGFTAPETPRVLPSVEHQILSIERPREYEIGSGAIRTVRNSGKPGYEVKVWRNWGTRQELIAHHSYPVMNRVVEFQTND